MGLFTKHRRIIFFDVLQVAALYGGIIYRTLWYLSSRISVLKRKLFLVKEIVGQDYFGRFCGKFQESQAPGKQRYYNCRGVLWVAGPRKLFVTKFSFQPGFLETGKN